MLTYIIRRLLYSIVVLVAASFLVFVFVAKSGDPLAALAIDAERVASSRSRTSASASTSTSRSTSATATGSRTRSRTSSARRCSTTGRSCPISGA